jgi:hypothetical protein
MVHDSYIIQYEGAVMDEALVVSKHLFGNQDRLLVAAAIARAEPGALYAQALAELSGMTEKRVGLQLPHFLSAGLLTKLPKVGSERRIYYERRESAFWSLCASLATEIEERVTAD